ncbi:MAG: Anaerobic regulatory protein [Steroidobacteraceae bacterium]|nr:Anaerobic regulatory protein [Steroidobacteraceae bacterium]
MNLNELELFRSLPAAALERLRGAMRVEAFVREAIVFRQGDPATRAYALGAGSIRIVQTGRDGGSAIVRFITAGEMFGTVPLFTRQRLPATAFACEESRVLSWSEADLRRMIDLYPAIAMNVIAVLGVRLADMQERVRDLATHRAQSRIAGAVLRLAARAGADTAGGRAIGIPLRRKDVAEFSGTTLHTASRTLAAWEKTGLLASSSGHLTVRDRDGLRRIAEESGPLPWPACRKFRGDEG